MINNISMKTLVIMTFAALALASCQQQQEQLGPIETVVITDKK